MASASTIAAPSCSAANLPAPARRQPIHRTALTVVLLAMALAACSAPASREPTATPSPRVTATTTPGLDPETAAALIRIAQVFNNDFGNNIDGPVWDRWDARSQAVISRADY